MITIKDDDVYTNWASGSYTSIALSNDSVSVNGDGVTYEGTKITITSGGTYVFTGTLTDGSITVSTQKTEDVRIILNGVDITCSDGPAINVAEADKVTISLEKGTDSKNSRGAVAHLAAAPRLFLSVFTLYRLVFAIDKYPKDLCPVHLRCRRSWPDFS